MNDFQKLYVLGKFAGDTWEFAGLFSRKAKAIEQVDGPGYFIAPAYVDMVLPKETIDWPDLELVSWTM